ncbi:MAG: D-alanyl-D-alanine carboxypeptidase family protein [Blastocatellia bacterium]
MQTIEQRQWFLCRLIGAQGFGVFIIAIFFSIGLITQSAVASSKKHPARSPQAAARRTNSASGEACASCEGSKRRGRNDARLAKTIPCHPKGYIDPKVAKNYQTAMRELRRNGIRPQVTSVWRSSQEQARLHRCSNNRRCRANHPGLYYALPPGQSLHEAGFAVDISGVAAGPRGRKQVTPHGRRIISVMRKNGFKWRYGLKDPAHFEADPTRKGYHSVKQAIHKNQTTCTVKLASAQRQAGRAQTVSTSRRAVIAKPISRRVSVDKLRRRNS